MNKYAVIVGQGRSGTNWLLDLFDLSSHTYCRNEPHELLSSSISKLDSHRSYIRKDQAQLIENWDRTIDEVGRSMGVLDPWIKSKKDYLGSGKSIYLALRSNKFRKVLGLMFNKYSVDEWLFPLSAVNLDQWEAAYRVFKFVQSPGWAHFLLKNKPDVHVFHIVRHPGGFLNSWKNRFLSQQNEDKVLADNLRRLKSIADEDVTWMEKFGDADQLGLTDSELWYWYYANEIIYQAGKGKDNYTLISYEELANDPISKLKELYSAAELVLDEKVQERVGVSSEKSKVISDAWKHKLDSVEISACQSFIDLANHSFLPIS